MRTRYKLVLVSSLLMAAESLCVSEAAPWQTVSYAEDGFAVDFSGEVYSTTENESGYRSTHYIQDGGDYGYFVFATQYAEGAAIDFDGNGNRGISVLECAVTDDDTSPASAADRSREYHGSKCSLGVRAGIAYFLAGRWFYQVMYLIPDDGDSSDAEHFLHSFKLIAK